MSAKALADSPVSADLSHSLRMPAAGIFGPAPVDHTHSIVIALHTNTPYTPYVVLGMYVCMYSASATPAGGR